jgi:hypothetical protein
MNEEADVFLLLRCQPERVWKLVGSLHQKLFERVRRLWLPGGADVQRKLGGFQRPVAKIGLVRSETVPFDVPVCDQPAHEHLARLKITHEAPSLSNIVLGFETARPSRTFPAPIRSTTEKAIRTRLARINGVVNDLPQFAHGFGCKVGQPMVRTNACKVW